MTIKIRLKLRCLMSEGIIAIDPPMKTLRDGSAKLEMVRHTARGRSSHINAPRRIVISFFEELRCPTAKEEGILKDAGFRTHPFVQIL